MKKLLLALSEGVYKRVSAECAPLKSSVKRRFGHCARRARRGAGLGLFR